MASHSLVLSFHPEQLRLVRELEPSLPLQGFPHRYLSEPCNDLYRLVDKVCVWNQEATVSETNYFKSLGLTVDIYPVDTEEQLERVLPLAIDSFTTNNIEAVMPMLEKRGLR